MYVKIYRTDLCELYNLVITKQSRAISSSISCDSIYAITCLANVVHMASCEHICRLPTRKPPDI